MSIALRMAFKGALASSDLPPAASVSLRSKTTNDGEKQNFEI